MAKAAAAKVRPVEVKSTAEAIIDAARMVTRAAREYSVKSTPAEARAIRKAVLAVAEEMRGPAYRHAYAPPFEEDPLVVWLMTHGSQTLETKRAANRSRVRDQKAEKTKRARLAAQWYDHFCKERPGADATEIYELICNKLDVEERTLQSLLSEARKRGLIPKRHVRKTALLDPGPRSTR